MTLTTNGSEVGSSYQGYFERPGAIPGREMTLGPHGSSEGRWQACIMTPKPNSPHITEAKNSMSWHLEVLMQAGAKNLFRNQIRLCFSTHKEKRKEKKLIQNQ